MKKSISFPLTNIAEFKSKMLNWAKQFNIFCFLDNQQYDFTPSEFECLLGVGCIDFIETQSGNALQALHTFQQKHVDWIFGHIGYDLKNEIEELTSSHPDKIGFSDLGFFVPETVIQISKEEVIIHTTKDANLLFQSIVNTPLSNIVSIPSAVTINSRFSKEEYIQTVKEIQKHILRGDCYELNFCQEFYVEQINIDPLSVFLRLTQLSPNPFAAFYKWNNTYCIGASPERYLKRTGNTLISQPIKGTAKRNLMDSQADNQNKLHLQNSEKEKSENVMVVDLVRNDLSKVCKEGTVVVDELFGIYSFPQVHQMISTIKGEIAESVSSAEIIRSTFPMGSMTGAPKKRVMQLIEEFERTKRGLFSGSIGYFTPDGQFDFNVVIRSILYNQTTGYLSFQTGGAITFYSDAEKEYAECLLKASAIQSTLS